MQNKELGTIHCVRHFTFYHSAFKHVFKNSKHTNKHIVIQTNRQAGDPTAPWEPFSLTMIRRVVSSVGKPSMENIKKTVSLGFRDL
jgi:hypothetical protein